jgi:hypothetical protein
MKILVCNSGSSSLKFSLLEADQELVLAALWSSGRASYHSLVPYAATRAESRRFDFSDIPFTEGDGTNVACREYLVGTSLATHFDYGTRSAKRSEAGRNESRN